MNKKIEISAALGLPPIPSYSPDSIGALLWAREVLRDHVATTFRVKDPKGIEELKMVSIGGTDQCLHIRGRNRNNPVLLVLHGGPGYGNIGFVDAIQRPWEDYFTVVQWDQRQTGKSFYPPDDENNPLNVQQFIEDTEEVIQYLLNHLEKHKLFIMGCSWGSVLGMHMVKRRPDWLHAHIGVGQVVSGMDNERVLFERLLAHAKEQNKIQLVAKLEAITPYPNPDLPGESFAKNNLFVRKELSSIAGESLMHHMPFIDAINMFSLDRLLSPHLTLHDLSNVILGGETALYRPPYGFTADFLSCDLPNDIGSSFEVPIFFFTGTHDWQTPVALSDKWFAEIDAPFKELIHFEESSHAVVNEEPGKFLMALVNKVLPFAEDVTDEREGK